MDILDLLKAYIDVGAVLLGVAVTQFIKWLLPTPIGGKTFDVSPFANKFLPAVPLIVGAVTVIIKDGAWTPTMRLDEAIVKGLVSGAVAAYLYRTAKVLFFDKSCPPASPTS